MNNRLKMPLAVFLQITNRCNSQCLICPYKDTYKKLPAELMSIDLFKKIMTDLTLDYKGEIGLYLHCEPLLDRRLPELITLARKLCPKAFISISTNASLLTGDNADKLCNTPIDLVVFNINGGVKRTYEKLMFPLKWGVSIDNIKNFLKKYKKRSYINFIKVTENADETKLLEKIFPKETIRKEFWAVNRGGSVVVNKPLDAKNRFKEKANICSQLSINMNIICDGSMLLCCNCWNKEVIMGNANNENILEIWNNSSERHYNHSICKKCN